MKHRLVVLTAVIAAALGMAACGSSSNSSSSSAASSAAGSSSSSSAAGKAPSGSPVKLMAIGAINAPGFSLPSIPVGAQVAVNEINKGGGLNGHPIQLITCNDKNDPNTATGCARQAIQEKVAAVVGGLSIFDLKIIPYLDQAGIPWIGPATPDDYKTSNLFLIGDEGLPGYVAIGMALAKQGCQKVSIVISAQGVPAYGPEIAAGVTAGGGKVVSTTQAPASSPDWSSIVSAAKSAGADCLGAGTGPSETAGLLGANNAGPHLKVVLLGGGLPSALLKQLGASANGVMSISGYLPQTAPGVQPLSAAAKALAPKTTFDGFTEHGYASVKVVQQAAKGLSTITAATLMKALPTIKDYDTGLGPVVDFAKTPPVAAFPRLFNPYYYLAVAKNGTWYLKEPAKKIDVTAGLKLLASKQ